MKKIRIAIYIVMFFCSFCSGVIAATKEDILNYVNSQQVGDAATSAVFNSYKATFTRLLRQKELSSTDCDNILGYLQTAVGILNSKGVSKLSDLKNLTAGEKSTVYSSLQTGASIITNAPALGSTSAGPEDKKDTKPENSTGSNSNNSNTTISVNTEDGTLDIYDNGVLIDKVTVGQSRLTYTGPNKSRVNILVISSVVLVVSLFVYIMLISKHTAKRRFVKNILMSCMICSGTILFTIFVFGRYLDNFSGLLSMIKVNISDEVRDVEIDEHNTIKVYPSYGNKYAKLLVESLGIDVSVAYGDTTEILKSNVGQSTIGHFPTEGDMIVLSGHNRDNMLGKLKNVSIGQKIVLDTSYAKCTYIVKETGIINDTDTGALKNKDNKETLIIYTCYPFSEYIYGAKRFIVYSVLDSVEWK